MPGRVRIIGGRWRRRLLTFSTEANIRPTPDRVRETLFNWLTPLIEGARCLDLFAGSGALGFEAASRGAAEVVMIERDAAAARHLREQANKLGADQVRIVPGDAIAWLRTSDRPFDVVFLDPPFRGGLLESACTRLAEGGWLKPGALIYMESESDIVPTLPPGWRTLRSKKAGQVSYYLAESD